MTYQRKNRGVCSLSTTVTLAEDGTIENVEVRGTTCGNRPTSCPDQIAQALEEALAQ